jgi:hypothetical protein
MDDDVVLTVADSAVAPAAAASLAAEPVAAPVTDEVVTAEPVTPEPVTTEIVAPVPTAAGELATRAEDDAPAPQDERLELELEPLTLAKPQVVANEAEAEFSGLELEPLVVAPSDETTPSDVAGPPTSEPQPAAVAPAMPEEVAPAAILAVDDSTAEPPAETPPATATVAPAEEADAIALQVDQDLDELSAGPPDRSSGDGDEAVQPPQAATAPATPAREPAPYPQLVHAAEREDEPAEFLLEEAPRKVPVSALVASAQASRAQLSDTLAAIESELFGSTRPPTDAPSDPAEASIPAKPARAPAAQGPLAALAAMCEEERIALFS